jgi:hypothetical protein
MKRADEEHLYIIVIMVKDQELQKSLYPPKCFTNNIDTAVRFMLPKPWVHWQLYIRGRKYDLPLDNSRGNRKEVIELHLAYCVELDKSFYE